MAESELHRKGNEIRRRLLGDKYVERVNATTYQDPIMRTFIDVATENVFGALWARSGLDLKTGSPSCGSTCAWRSGRAGPSRSWSRC